MTLRVADSDKEDDYTVATCLEHAGDTLTMFTQHAAGGRMALVQATWLSPDTALYNRCSCGQRAAFVLVHVYDDEMRHPPVIPADPLAVGSPAGGCPGRQSGQHHYACVTCGAKPNSW